MRHEVTKIHSAIAGRSFAAREGRGITITEVTDAALDHLAGIGLNFQRGTVRNMVEALIGDAADNTPLVTLTTQSIPTPIQFLQNWLPGFVRVITAARKIDLLVGMNTVGAWEDEEVVQGVLEPVGTAQPYADYGNIPFASWNPNYERRTVVRFEQGFQVGLLEEARTARARISTSAEKRTSATLSLEIARNKVGFSGFNGGNNRTYGFLNDPALPAASAFPNGGWATATFLEITGDINTMIAALQTQSQDNINPEQVDIVLGLPTQVYPFLATVSDFGISVRDWLTKTYPRVRVESAPELNNAVGGENVVYLYPESVDDNGTDDGRVISQNVPAKFFTLGVEKRAKSYLEDFANATAGVLVKRPYAIVRRTGA